MGLIFRPTPRSFFTQTQAAPLPRAFGRRPDFAIGDLDKPYLLRWWVIPRNRLLNIYLHNIRFDDDDRAPHDHPWFSISFPIKGKLIEHRHEKPSRVLKRFRLYFRGAKALHRLEVGADRTDPSAQPQAVWTLFITGPKVRDWGFLCPQARWVPWQKFTNANNPGEVGAGCGESFEQFEPHKVSSNNRAQRKSIGKADARSEHRK